MPTSPRSNSSTPPSPFPQALDRVAILFMVVFSLLIAILLWGGEHASAQVRSFSWQNKQVGAEDTAFILTFSRPMNHASVEENLQITPPLQGKVSWAGRRMAYTLTLPAPYGNTFQVQLQNANDSFAVSQRGNRFAVNGNRRTMQPFLGQFQSRDRAFAYIGVEGEEAGRLILFNLNKGQKQILTPKELVVVEFKPYSLGDRILFAATQRSDQTQGVLEQKLYTVTTGIQIQPPPQPDAQPSDAAVTHSKPAGTVELLLDNKDYQILKFDLSADGRIIVVQRANRSDPADFGPWLIRDSEPPLALKGNPGGDFLITPDSESLAIAQGQGLAILPLQPDAKPLDFLPKFGVVLSFARDNSLAAMVKFNTDRTRSLFLVSNQGVQKELIRIPGSILSAQFDPSKQTLYCLLTEIITTGELYREQPYLAAVDLKTSKLAPLALLPGQGDVQVSLSADGLALLFDQTTEVKDSQSAADPIRSSSGKVIANSQLWLLPVDPTNPTAKSQPESLPLSGLRPRWLP